MSVDELLAALASMTAQQKRAFVTELIETGLAKEPESPPESQDSREVRAG